MNAGLVAALRTLAGDALSTDADALAAAAADLYAAGPEPFAVLRPTGTAQLAAAVALCAQHDCSVVPRGGGLSYTGGYACEPGRSLLVDLAGMDRILEVSAEDMYVVVEAGVTWKQLHEALRPLGLRTPYFGTFSGAGATVGGGLSHGALFFGSARYGSAADNVLGVEVVTANGGLLRTGQWALRRPAPPVFRSFGPDTTGLLMHDGGAFGIKTRAALRLIPLPAATGHASWAFADFESAARALSAIAREGLAEEAYVLDPGAMAVNLERDRSLAAAWTAVRQVTAAARGAGGKARALAGLLAGGRQVVPENAFSLHMVAAGGSEAAVRHDLARARRLAAAEGAVVLAASVPRLVRADPFPGLDGVVGPTGTRWAALNAKVAHSQATALIAAHRALIEEYSTRMQAQGVRVTYLCSALGNHSFSFEAVFHWADAWHPIHEARLSPAARARIRQPAPDPAARRLVAELRERTCALFAEAGGASNQIGRTYPFLEVLDDAPAALLRALKRHLDPQRRMNPGVLGL